ncbi:MAG: Fe-S-containing protein [Acidaminococcales bacterium]|nr:Fe-S-containing protein [Acidaminococcales bacterium]
MLKYLIQVTQNLLAPVIILALFAALAAKGRHNRLLYRGLAAGAAAALLLAAFKTFTVLVNREYVNIVLLTLGIVTELFLLALLWGSAKGRSAGAHGWALDAIGAVFAAALAFYYLPDIFLYPTEFLLAGESAFSTDFLFKTTGYLCGLLLTALIGAVLFRTAACLPAGFSLGVFGLCLTVGLISQASLLVQFLLARRIIPMKDWLFALLMPAINYRDFFLYIMMAVTLILPLLLYKRSLRVREPYANPAELRKLKSGLRLRRRFSALTVAGYIGVLFCLTAVKAYAEREVVLSPIEPMKISDGVVVLPLETINDWRLHRYAYEAGGGVQVRFIVIRKNNAAYGVGLDACDICGPTGYYERDDQVICKLCDVVMNKSTIGFKGGCNPVPLAYALRGGAMLIDTKELEKEKTRFR